MSTQSGIIASSELLARFQNLVDQTLLVTVSDDQTQLVEDESYVQPTSFDLTSVFKGLHNHFSRIYPQPGYAIFPRPNSKDFVFIAFIPDLAPIRQKMLYASTKNTLIQQMGSGAFGKKYILAFTELEELTPDNYDRATRSSSDPTLLTSNEIVLQNIDRLQALSVSQASPSAFKKELPSMHGGAGSLLFEIEEGLDKMLRQDLHKQLVMINVNANEHLVLTSHVSDVSLDALIKTACLELDFYPSPSPLYIMYGYAPSKVAFIYLCPSGSKVRDRMLYATSKKGLISHLKSKYFSPSQLEKVLEVGDLDEIDLSVLEVGPTQESAAPRTSLKFTKPKGPRRK